jgi:hypothetical protein
MNEKFRTLKIIHLAICAGTAIAYLTIGKLSMDAFKINIGSSEMVYAAIPVLAIVLGNMLFKLQLKKADPTLKPEDNLGIYQTASLVRWAILEGSAFLILFTKPDLLVLGILIILYQAYFIPPEEKMTSDLQNSIQ